MLAELRVQNFILIDQLELRLEPGFNVLTGETGAGKSIVVGALGLVLGGRARAEMVRPGAEEACVEALFEVGTAGPLVDRLTEMGVPVEGELVVRRVVQTSGRSRAYLNGRLCTVGELTSLATLLADVTSQHESVALTDQTRHLLYLDRYAQLEAERAALGELVDELLTATRKLAALRAQEKGRAEREAFLRFQLEAIDEIDPQPGEVEPLEQERNRLKHAERLATTTQRVATQLEEDDRGLCDRLGRLAADLRGAAEIDRSLETLASELDDCWTRLQDCSREVARYAEGVSADPGRLGEVQDRLYKLEELRRKHGPTEAEVLETRERIREEIATLDGVDAAIDDMQAKEQELLEVAGQAAQALSKRRRKAARRLGDVISSELQALGMGRAKVVVDVAPLERNDASPSYAGARLSREGLDRAQFLIAPNRGMAPRPLGKIASGGELSRALLALKRALAGLELDLRSGSRAPGVQVFDEVDSGVGGETADRIGRAIAGIASQRQVLCITHLAAIAAHAQAHFIVTKDEATRTTTTTIQRANGPARVAEIARMLTGAKVTGPAKRAAKELLALASVVENAAE
ncbi:MAG: DNA repair protein RecN [Polyangiaceae bacterium]